jgi:uncharacterized protein YciI
MILTTDKPNHGHLRQANRPAHLEYLRSFGKALYTAGPTLSEDGATVTGSLIIVERAGRKEALDFAAGDPYAKAGLFESTVVKPWRKVF